jgi:hypothetical protein
MSLNHSTEASPQPGIKRKRNTASKLNKSIVATDTSQDEQIAQQLQDDEYNGELEEIAPPSKRSRSGKKQSVGDEELARQLQEKEYDYELPIRPSPKKRGHSSRNISVPKTQHNALQKVLDSDMDVSDSSLSVLTDSVEVCNPNYLANYKINFHSLNSKVLN